MTFAGRIYDGPLEGEQRAEGRPWFHFNVMPRRSILDFDPRRPPEIDYCYRCEYRWSYPLRAWVFDWTTAPQAPEQPAKRHIGRTKRARA